MEQVAEKNIIDNTVIPFLRDYLGYDPTLMKRDVTINVPLERKTKKIDLVFYVSDQENKTPYLLVEVKKPGISLDLIKFEIEKISLELNCPYFLITNGEQWNWHSIDFDEKTSYKTKDEIHYYKITGVDKLTAIKNIHEAQSIIGYCHDVIWNEKSSTPEDALKELSKFVIAKIIDEQEVETHRKESYEFKIKSEKEDVIDIKNRINFLLLKAKKLDPDIFVDKKPEINLKPYSIIKIVQSLQNYSLTQTNNVEILGETYQGLLKKVYTDRVKGQRFTPRTVVDLMVFLIDPDYSKSIYDPACGTGGFLVSVLKHVKKKLSNNSKNHNSSKLKEQLKSYSTSKLFGTDIEPTVIQLAKANMLVHGDGHTHVMVKDALEFGTKSHEFSKIIEKQGGFDIILTNPPFGGTKIDPDILNKYQLAKNETSEITQVLFIERCLNLLKPSGRMGIVLPEGILNNIKQKEVRKFILEKSIIKAVVSLPTVTFKPYGAGPKASILFLQKKNGTTKQGKIIMAQIENIGYSANGKEESIEDVSYVKKTISKMGGLQWNK